MINNVGTITKIFKTHCKEDQVLHNLLLHAYEHIPEKTNVLTNIALYITLCEYGYKPILHYGQISIPTLWKEEVKDHIWLTLNNKIIDFGIHEYSPILFGQIVDTKSYELLYHHHFLEKQNSLCNFLYTNGISLILINPMYGFSSLLNTYMCKNVIISKIMINYKQLPIHICVDSCRRLALCEDPKTKGLLHVFSQTIPNGYILKSSYVKFIDPKTYNFLLSIFTRQELEQISLSL